MSGKLNHVQFHSPNCKDFCSSSFSSLQNLLKTRETKLSQLKTTPFLIAEFSDFALHYLLLMLYIIPKVVENFVVGKNSQNKIHL